MFFGPKFASLVFSDTSIKISVAKPSSKRFKVSMLVSKQLPPKTVFNGRIVNRDVFGEELKSLFLENFDKLKTKNVIVGLPEQEVFVSAFKFPEKPKHTLEAIKERLVPLLPFEISSSELLYEEISKNYYQIAAARTEELKLISSLVGDAGFTIKALVPTPLILAGLVGKQPFPYLVLSSEENLIFTLVVENAVVFSSTVILKQSPSASEKEILQVANEIVEKEYPQPNQDTLKKVFLHGSGTEYLKSYLSSAGFDCEVIFASDKTDTKTGVEANNYGRAITLSLFSGSGLFFPKISVSKDVDRPKVKGVGDRKINPILLFIPLLLIAAVTIFIFWPNLKDIFLSSDKAASSVEPTKHVSPSAQIREKEATPSTKKETTESAKLAITKKDVKIRILNGSGQAGAAGTARDFIVSKGYLVESVGNAPNFSSQKTTLQYKKSVKEISGLLTKDLEARYAINIGSALSESESFDILITIGGE